MRGLVAENQSIRDHVNLDRYQSIPDTAVRVLNQRLSEAAASATVQDLLVQAQALERAAPAVLPAHLISGRQGPSACSAMVAILPIAPYRGGVRPGRRFSPDS